MLPRKSQRVTQRLGRDKLQVLVRIMKIYSKMLSWRFIREVVPRAVMQQRGGGCCWGKYCLKHCREPPILVAVLLWLGLLLSTSRGGMRQ